MSQLLTTGVIQASLLNQSEPPDAAPTGLTLTVVDRTDIKLDWTDNATNEDGYKIERSLNGVDFTVIDTVAADTETYTDEDLDEITQYYYRVRAYKGEEYSAYTDIENETTGSPAFIITVDTTKAGSANDTFVLALSNGISYNFHIDWGDGNEEDVSGSSLTEKSHTYSSSGTYQIRITGTFPKPYFNNGGDKLKITSIDNWGTIVYDRTQSYTFYGCANMVANWNDVPGFIGNRGLRQTQRMFRNCAAMKANFGSWNITSCWNYVNMFQDCNINETGTTTNYDNTLIGWAAQTVEPNEPVDFGTSKYGQGLVDSGTTDGTTANKLVDSSQNFLTTVTAGDVIHNTTDDTYARVTAVDSDTTLSLETDIMTSGEAYVIQHSDAAKARASLILDDGWTLTDGGAA